jgi:hypothetical protein
MHCDRQALHREESRRKSDVREEDAPLYRKGCLVK